MATQYGDPARYAMMQQQRQDEQFRNLLNMMMGGRQFQARQQQFTQEQTRLREKEAFSQEMRQKEFTGLEKHRKVTEAISFMNAINDPRSSKEQTLALGKKILNPADYKQLERQIFLGREPQPSKPPVDKQFGLDTSLLKNGISRLEKERTRQIALLQRDIPENKRLKVGKTITNIEAALEQLYMNQAFMSSGKALSREDRKRMRRIASSMVLVKSGKFLEIDVSKDTILASQVPPNTQTATNKKTGEKKAWINGKWLTILQ